MRLTFQKTDDEENKMRFASVFKCIKKLIWFFYLAFALNWGFSSLCCQLIYLFIFHFECWVSLWYTNIWNKKKSLPFSILLFATVCIRQNQIDWILCKQNVKRRKINNIVYVCLCLCVWHKFSMKQSYQPQQPLTPYFCCCLVI